MTDGRKDQVQRLVEVALETEAPERASLKDSGRRTRNFATKSNTALTRLQQEPESDGLMFGDQADRLRRE